MFNGQNHPICLYSYISPRIIKRKSIIIPEYLIRTLKLLKAINRTNSKYVCTRNKNPKIKNGFEYHITQHRLQK